MLPLWTQIIGCFLATIVVIGNGLVICLITTRRKLRTTTNWFIVSLAVADVGIGTIYPTGAHNYQSASPSDIFWGPWLVFICASQTNLCALMLDRYLAIVKPLRYVIFMTKKRMVLLIFAAWIVACSALIPFFLLATRVLIFHCFITVSAFLILLVTTARIFLIARKHSRQNAALVKQLNFNHTFHCKVPEPQEAAAANMICIVVAVFLSYCLLHIYYMVCRYSTLCSLDETLSASNDLLILINSLANPTIYALFKRDIRKEINRLFSTKKLFCQQAI